MWSEKRETRRLHGHSSLNTKRVGFPSIPALVLTLGMALFHGPSHICLKVPWEESLRNFLVSGCIHIEKGRIHCFCSGSVAFAGPKQPSISLWLLSCVYRHLIVVPNHNHFIFMVGQCNTARSFHLGHWTHGLFVGTLDTWLFVRTLEDRRGAELSCHHLMASTFVQSTDFQFLPTTHTQGFICQPLTDLSCQRWTHFALHSFVLSSQALHLTSATYQHFCDNQYKGTLPVIWICLTSWAHSWNFSGHPFILVQLCSYSLHIFFLPFSFSITIKLLKFPEALAILCRHFIDSNNSHQVCID